MGVEGKGGPSVHTQSPRQGVGQQEVARFPSPGRRCARTWCTTGPLLPPTTPDIHSCPSDIFMCPPLPTSLLCAVVVKSTLVPFVCTSRGGVSTLDAEPSIVCGGTSGPHARMRAVAVVTVLFFVVGLPVGFISILRKYHVEVGRPLFPQLPRQCFPWCYGRALFPCVMSVRPNPMSVERLATGRGLWWVCEWGGGGGW